MKKPSFIMFTFFTLGLLLILTGLLIIRKSEINTFINSYLFPNNIKITKPEKNQYYRDYDFKFVKNTTNFVPNNFQDILNIYYTVINSGSSTFTFYCPAEYQSCFQDIQTLANDKSLLSDINNYTHPFNSFSHIETEIDSIGKVQLQVIHAYTKEQITMIEEKINELYPLLVNDNLGQKENIKNIHDYIINNSKYDSDRSDNNIIKYKSDIAYGPLFEGYAVCGGYSDLMELFLEKMNIKSFKVSTKSHVWNAVLLGDKWYHLDLTWDDPVATDGLDYLEHKYFLIETEQLISQETTQHIFDQDIYQEVKE